MCQIATTTALAPQTPAPPLNPKPLNPHAQPYKPSPLKLVKAEETLCQPSHLIFRQHRNCLSYYPFYVYQPRPLWLPYQPKVERYDVYSQPLEGNTRPYDEDCVGRSEKAGTGQVGVGGGLRDSGDEKIIKGFNRFISPRIRLQRKRYADQKKKWALKKSPEMSEAGPASAVGYEAMLQGKTSLMIKNIPNHFDRRDVLGILDKHCRKENSKAKLLSNPFRSEYDFVYLPMDFGFCANLGYAFVNFTTSAAALRFCLAFDKHEWEVSTPGQKKKICEITCATIQGKDGLLKNFENSKFSCHTRHYLPVILSPPRDGTNNTNPTPVGKCIGVGTAPPVNLRKVRLMMRKKASDN